MSQLIENVNTDGVISTQPFIDTLSMSTSVQNLLLDTVTITETPKIVITGAAGTIGSELAEILQGHGQLVLIDNDENGIFELKERLGDVGNKYMVIDIARERALEDVLNGAQAVYHCAAMKHVDICEANAWQAILTNVYGTRNMILEAIRAHVGRFVLVSTDKAVNPIGVMGATKLLAEKLMHFKDSPTKLITVRFGNIWASRGSLYMRIKHQIETDNPITITDPKMKRYFVSVQTATEFILEASEKGKNGETWIPKMKLETLKVIVEHIMDSLTENHQYPIKEIGRRPGEKMVEELMTSDEKVRCIESEKFYVIPPLDF